MTSLFDERQDEIKPGTPEISENLRKAFDVRGSFDMDISTTIVPVVIVGSTEKGEKNPSEHPWITSVTVLPALGNYAIASITNVGSGIIIVDAVMITAAGDVRMPRGISSTVSDFAAPVLYLTSVPTPSGLSSREQTTAALIAGAVLIHHEGMRDSDIRPVGITLGKGTSILFYHTIENSRLAITIWGREITP